MKKLQHILLIIIGLSLVTLYSCQDNNGEEGDNVMLSKIMIDIPQSISDGDFNKDTQIDTLSGNQAYEHMRNFIHVGEEAAQIVQDLIDVISTYNINKAMTFSYTSDDDGRKKNVTVVENANYEGKSWEFEMTVADDDGGKALQLIWNRDPIEGVAILHPYDLDRNEFDASYDILNYRIDYTEAPTNGYEKYMVISIAEVPDISGEKYHLDKMKMYVGKTGDIIEVAGNSNHPNAYLLDSTNTNGLSWSFRARANDALNIGVAEVALPPVTLPNTTDLFTTYSMHKIMFDEIYQIYPDSTIVNTYLSNTEAPGYFDNDGFISCGNNIPSADYTNNNFNIFTNNFMPYIPNDVNQLEVPFLN